MSDSYLVIELNHQPVELCKLLKIADLVSGGGEAKVVISEGYVSVSYTHLTLPTTPYV